MENNNDYLNQIEKNNILNDEQDLFEAKSEDLENGSIKPNMPTKGSNNLFLELLELNDMELKLLEKFLNDDVKKESLIINLDTPDYNSKEYKMFQTKYIENLINFYIIGYLNKNEKVNFEDLKEYLNNINFPDIYQINDEIIDERISDIINNPNYKDIKNRKKLFSLLNKKIIIEKYIKTLLEHEKTDNTIKNVLLKIFNFINDIKKENQKLNLLYDSIDDKKDELINLQNQISDLEKINEEAEQEVTNLKETKIVLKKQLKVLEEKLANSNSENNIEIENELEELRKKENDAKEKIDILQEDLNKTKEELENIRESKIELKKENAQLQEILKKQDDFENNANVDLLKEELNELKDKKIKLKKELEELKNELLNNSSNEQEIEIEKTNSKEDNNRDDYSNKDEKEIEKPKSSKKIFKYILYGIGGFFVLIVSWFVYAFAFAPVKDNSLSTAIQKVTPQQKIEKKQINKKEKKAYDFNKKLTEEEFKKQKFDIYKNNEFACRINGRRFKANDIINGWMFRKTVPSWKKLIFTDPAETKSFAVNMENE